MSGKAIVGVLMGSKSDWETMQEAAKTLRQLGVPFEAHVASAHRTPDKVIAFCETAEARGLKVIIAAAGGAAHLAGFCAGKSHLPVLGVPMKGWALDGMDSLLSTVQMPAGVPVATFAIGKAGAINAALFAAQLLSLAYPSLREQVLAFRKAQTEKVLADDNLELP
ncbi:MAG TPA: 5-(carboxyamino)imidazole ribonucleotide mutase [Holophaga sp.]|nr:5-(carboxyamino)imidazole ribonucleotide mutase [Holophaga sp.]